MSIYLISFISKCYSCVHFIYLAIVYLTTVSASQIMQRQIAGLVMNRKLLRDRKELGRKHLCHDVRNGPGIRL
jgi:hypothetical protein